MLTPELAGPKDQPAGRAELQYVLDVHLLRPERECLSRGRDDVELKAPGGDHRTVAPKFVLVLTAPQASRPFALELTLPTRFP